MFCLRVGSHFKPTGDLHDKNILLVEAEVISGRKKFTLAQEGVLAGGRHVALTGKVYALATATKRVSAFKFGNVQSRLGHDFDLSQ